MQFLRCIVHQTEQENVKSSVYKKIDLKLGQVFEDV